MHPQNARLTLLASREHRPIVLNLIPTEAVA